MRSDPTSPEAFSSDPWHELEQAVEGLSNLARTPIGEEEFYREMLAKSVRAISIVGGAVWLQSPQGIMRTVAQLHWPASHFGADDASRRAHEALLNQVAESGQIMIIDPDNRAQSGAGNPTGDVLVLGAVRIQEPAHESDVPTTIAILELLVHSDLPPSVYQGCEQFVSTLCEIAADYHAFRELRHFRGERAIYLELLNFSRTVHERLQLKETSYAIVNEGRRLVGCDRLTVLKFDGRRCRLLATSGLKRVERRSRAVRQLESLGEMAGKLGDALYYDNGACDALPQVAEALDRYVEESTARQIAILPVRLTTDSEDANSNRPIAVLVAEQFDADAARLAKDRLLAVSQTSATALANALEMDRLPLRPLFQGLGKLKELLLPGRRAKTALAIVALAAIVAALVLIQVEFKIDVPGTIQPAVQQNVFAARTGLVDEVLVKHGDTVQKDQVLLRLRDPNLDLQHKQVYGELETNRRQLDAVRATKTNRAIRDADPIETYRLSAQDRELAQRVENLQRELDLITQERESLMVRSPLAGQVLTWDVNRLLVARPVERGQVLLTVADPKGPWQLELAVPDDRIGYVLEAQKSLQPDLPVRFRLVSDDYTEHTGAIDVIRTTADVDNAENATARPTIAVTVALPDLSLSEAKARDLRPGVTAQAAIVCGRRSLGFIWLHDIWHKIVQWFRF